jgi:hypothetical protein
LITVMPVTRSAANRPDNASQSEAEVTLMKQQRDEIARENPFYGVLSLNAYENAATVDLDKFWRAAVETLMPS